jgi:serine protease AprX
LAGASFFFAEWKMQAQASKLLLPLRPYVDARTITGEKRNLNPGDFTPNDIITYTYNESTVFGGSEDLARKILENGKNPGLGVRALHAEGITGKGVNVAIIDQNLLLDHPEFKGKIAAYHDTGCGTPADSGSMHAPAVTSLLVGKTIGTALDASVYYAAVPSWNKDSKYYADALYWIMEQNRNLTKNNKIRVVSISAAPAGWGSQFTKNQQAYVDAVTEAQKEGILVLDCMPDEITGFVSTGFCDFNDPDNFRSFTLGSPSNIVTLQGGYKIAAPTSQRTVAEEYTEGNPSYQYTGQGGLSWGIPYVAGILAMGWQVAPHLGNGEIVQMLYSSCYIDKNGNHIINPKAFIIEIKNSFEE